MSPLRQPNQSLSQGGDFMKRRPSSLINRRNYTDTRRYLEYCEEVRQNGAGTLRAVRTAMDHLLRWATSVPLTRSAVVRPGLPQYLEGLEMSVGHRDKVLLYTRHFFEYARNHWERYEAVPSDWLESLRAKDQPGTVQKREKYTVDQVRAILALEPENLTDERDIAAVAFLFLSGMRVGAFVSLPLRAVDWNRDPARVRQWPDLGVRTKNSKAANTFLLAHPELEDLREVARTWYYKAYAAVGERGMVYTLLTSSRDFDPVQVPGDNRANGFRRRLRALCQRAEVPDLSPHKLRHGHVVWGLKKCRTMAEYKAVSQNIMHESLTTTDAIYSGMVDEEVAGHIAGLGMHREEVVIDVDALAEALFRRKIGTG
jgi:integrase